MKRRITALLLTLCLMVSLVPTLAATATDVKGHWAESNIEALRTLGIMEGYPDGTFRPNNNVTKAELVTLLNRTFGLKTTKSISYSDVDSTKWYYSQFRLATDYVFTFSNKVYPDTPLTRQEAAAMFGRLMSFTDTTGTSAFSDDSSIASWAKNYIYAGAAKNLITGYPEGTFKPLDNISRAEVATVLVRLIGNVIDRAGTYSTLGSYANTTVMASGVTLKNVHITGDLYITAGVGAGLVTLEGCTIDGEIIAVGNPGCTVIFSGTTNKAAVRGDGVSIAVTGTVADLTVTSANQIMTSLNVTSGASVQKLTMKTPAAVSGAVGTAYLYVSGVSFTVMPDAWNLNTGATVTIGGTLYNTSGTKGPGFSTNYPTSTVKLSSNGTRQTISVTVKLEELAQIYCIAVPRGSTAPTSEQVRARTNYGSVVVSDSNFAVYNVTGVTKVLEMSNLALGTSYDVYVVAESMDASPKLGSVIKLQPDVAIYANNYPAVYGMADTSVTVSVKTVRTATIYMTAVLAGLTAPTADQMKNGTYGVSLGSITTAADLEQKLTLSGLTAGSTAYDLYVAAADVGGVPKSTDIVKFALGTVGNAVNVSFSETPTNNTYPIYTIVTLKFSDTVYKTGASAQLGTAGAMPTDLIRLTAIDTDRKTAVAVSGYSMLTVGNTVVLTPPVGGWTSGCTYTLNFSQLSDAKGQKPTPVEYTFSIAANNDTLKAPYVTPAAGSSVQPGGTINLTVSSANASAGAILIYTIDGSDPRSSTTAYSVSGQIGATVSIPASATPGTQYRIRAVAYLNSAYSAETDAIFTVENALLRPIVTLRDTGAELPSGTEITSGTAIQIAGIDSASIIYYTTDGTTPTTSGTYGTRVIFNVSGATGTTVTIKAILARGSYVSDVYTFTYLISSTMKDSATTTPIITLGATGDVLADRTVVNLTANNLLYVYSFNDYEKTSIYYTLDGSDPASSVTRSVYTQSSPGTPFVFQASTLLIGVQTRLRLIVFNSTTGAYSQERELYLYRVS
ncbi:MAG: S-layer homology domain-containing protein [Clostridiaceae bacterium]|nr:S-layer homology domain-containing protein [Clostridiaceae bacterium]